MAAKYEPLVITTVLPDFMLEKEGKTVFLECEVNKNPESEATSQATSFLWFKDNVPVTPSYNKIEISNDDLWHILKIKSVTKDDQGIYCFVIKSTTYDVFSMCKLYVKPKSKDSRAYYFPKPLRERVWVESPLLSCNVPIDGPFQLQAKFSTEITELTWYKNNREIYSSHPRFLINDHDDKMSTKLCVQEARVSDTGKYSVVAKTNKNAYLCSFTDVHVAWGYSTVLFNNETVPYICGNRRNTVAVYEKDDVMVRSDYDTNSDINVRH